MEFPTTNRVSDFESLFHSLLTSPSFISRVLRNIFQLGNHSESYQLWILGALLLAVLFTFTHIIRKTKILVFKHHKPSSSLSDPLLSDFDSDISSGDGDDDSDVDVEVCSSSYSSDDNNKETTSPSCDNLSMRFEDFRVAGGSSHYSENQHLHNRKSKLRRRHSIADNLSLSEIVNCRSVVKLWDGLGSKVAVDGSSINCGIDSFFAPTPAVSSPPSSPSLVVSSTSESVDGRFGFSAWDTRMRRETPAIHAEWKPQRGSEAAAAIGVNHVGRGVGKVYVRDKISRDLTVGDLRRVDSPLGNVKEYDDNEDDATCTFWDAVATDTLIATAESFPEVKVID